MPGVHGFQGGAAVVTRGAAGGYLGATATSCMRRAQAPMRYATAG